jgi:hypothetical protein
MAFSFTTLRLTACYLWRVMQLYAKGTLESFQGLISYSFFSPSGPILTMTDFLKPVEQFVFFLGGPRIIPLSLHWILL